MRRAKNPVPTLLSDEQLGRVLLVVGGALVMAAKDLLGEEAPKWIFGRRS